MPQRLNHRFPGTPTHARLRGKDTCQPWRALLPEAAENLLEPLALQSLEAHLESCPGCRAEMHDAQRGLAWLTMLKDDAPAPPQHMLSDILAHTTGAAEAGVYLPDQSAYPPDAETLPGAWQTARSWLRGDEGTWSSLLQPHFAMTGAMAFLSVCLTINLLGDSLSLHKAAAHHLERSVATTEASVMRSLAESGVLSRVESRVDEMRTAAERTTRQGSSR